MWRKLTSWSTNWVTSRHYSACSEIHTTLWGGRYAHFMNVETEARRDEGRLLEGTHSWLVTEQRFKPNTSLMVHSAHTPDGRRLRHCGIRALKPKVILGLDSPCQTSQVHSAGSKVCPGQALPFHSGEPWPGPFRRLGAFSLAPNLKF